MAPCGQQSGRCTLTAQTKSSLIIQTNGFNEAGVCGWWLSGSVASLLISWRLAHLYVSGGMVCLKLTLWRSRIHRSSAASNESIIFKRFDRFRISHQFDLNQVQDKIKVPKQPSCPPPSHLLEDLAEQYLSIERFHVISIDFEYRIKSNWVEFRIVRVVMMSLPL